MHHNARARRYLPKLLDNGRGGRRTRAWARRLNAPVVRPGGRAARAAATGQDRTAPKVTGRESGPTVKNDGE
ncbi:hypothetical protein GCM10009727_33650 [Actinomadura napierensis]|uniref:Uncharacterized protein n=1 Tax=Actinomadura napierensis TaxID=267854 RepID=A0ABN2Z7Q9_9ACTN